MTDITTQQQQDQQQQQEQVLQHNIQENKKYKKKLYNHWVLLYDDNLHKADSPVSNQYVIHMYKDNHNILIEHFKFDEEKAKDQILSKYLIGETEIEFGELLASCHNITNSYIHHEGLTHNCEKWCEEIKPHLRLAIGEETNDHVHNSVYQKIQPNNGVVKSSIYVVHLLDENTEILSHLEPKYGTCTVL